jgi:hypothetical protein
MFLDAVIGWVFFLATGFTMVRDLLTVIFTPRGGAPVPKVGPVPLVVSIEAWWSLVGPNAFQMDHEESWRWRGGRASARARRSSLAGASRHSSTSSSEGQ